MSLDLWLQANGTVRGIVLPAGAELLPPAASSGAERGLAESAVVLLGASVEAGFGVLCENGA